jgi:hypothetical protein
VRGGTFLAFSWDGDSFFKNALDGKSHGWNDPAKRFALSSLCPMSDVIFPTAIIKTSSGTVLLDFFGAAA